MARSAGASCPQCGGIGGPVGEGGAGEGGGGRAGEGGGGRVGRPAVVKPVTASRMHWLGNGGGWIRTGGVDKLGRPGPVEFLLNKDAERAPRANRAATPRGFARVQAWADRLKPRIEMQRTHLVANQFGGTGPDDPANVIIAPRQFNTSLMRKWELKMRKLIRGGETIYVKETPIYAGRELVPRSLQIDIWREDGGHRVYETGACLNVWPGRPPSGIPTG